MTHREEWEAYGPKDKESPIQEMHEVMHGLAKRGTVQAIVFGVTGAACIGKALYEMWHGAYFKGVVDSSENIYDALGTFDNLKKK